jgi:ribonuclease HI
MKCVFAQRCGGILFYMKDVEIYCDGSSLGNPGPGGWGAVVADKARVKEIGGYDVHTTNNKMELTAPIEALELIHTRANVTINTDSQYVINGITKWVFGWEKNGWQTKEKKDVLNKELWQALVKVSQKHDVHWKHVRGHSGVALNERVDVIANGFARKEETELYYGSLTKYKEFLKTMPKARVVSKSGSKTKKTGPAYSYVSVIDGKVLTHTTWAECEKRVKGKNAKYKKVFSKGEEGILIAEWRGQ